MSNALPDAQPVVCSHEIKAGEKCYDCYPAMSAYSWLGGATSFADVDAYEAAQETQEEVGELTAKYQTILNNIFSASEDMIPFSKKPDLIDAATKELRRRIAASPTMMTGMAERKGFLASVKDLVMGPPSTPNRTVSMQTLVPFVMTAPPAEPKAEVRGGFKMMRDVNGDYRWITVYSNDAKDRDDEHFPLGRHREFVDWVDAGSKAERMPELWAWHTPGTKMGQADMIDLTTEGFMVATGHVDEGMEQAAENLRAMGPLGVSHGYVYASKEAGEIGPYRTFEISPLPASRAANPYTGFLMETPTEDQIVLTPEKKDFLASVFGTEKASDLETSLASAAAQMKAAGKSVGWKEVLEAFKEDPPALDPAPAAAAGITLEQLQTVLTGTLAPFTEAINGLTTGLTAVSAEVKEIKAQPSMAPRSATLLQFSPTGGNGVDGSHPGVKEAAATLPAGEGGDVPAHLSSHFEMLGLKAN